MAFKPTTFVFLSLMLSTSSIVSGKGFLQDDTSAAAFSARMLDRDLQTAMEEVMGCGNREVSSEALASIKESIQTMWDTMPKNSYGNLEWRSLRYVAHRHFMHKSSMLIRGMEPQLALSSSENGAAEILSQQVPGHVSQMLGGEQAKRGYDIDDAVALLAALEQLVFDSETALLEQVYKAVGKDNTVTLGDRSTKSLLEAYMVHWMLGEDKKSIGILMRNRTILENEFPHWSDISSFVEGRIKLMDYQRAKNVQKGVARSLMDRRHSFSDAHTVVGGITTSFQSYWESECVTMKSQLVEMDKTGTGRVKLSDFYGTGMEADWRFGESEPYLQELGVIDNSSPWLGKQVIVANYILAASNCIVSTPHYLLCCQNECESLLREIEDGIRTPMANPEAVLQIVRNLTSSSMQDPPQLTKGLADQLHIVAKAHGGQVPLHGRLFAQWLHYAYPHECPFPHKVGTFKAQTLTPDSFGDFRASQADMEAAVNVTISLEDAPSSENDAQLLDQWSAEEELFADYTHMTAPWEAQSGWRLLLALMSLIGLTAVAFFGGFSPAPKSTESHMARPHLV